MKVASHHDLCKKASAWLKRSYSQSGPGCNLAFSEVISSSNGGEIPDAIGFRTAYGNESFLVEVKVSENDFFADRKKPHRTIPSQGMGNYRYYLAPEGMIKVTQLPEKWGLIEVGARSKLKLVHGYGHENWKKEPWYMDSNRDAEIGLLTLLMKKVSSPEKTIEAMKSLRVENQRLKDQAREDREASHFVASENFALRNALRKHMSETDIDALLPKGAGSW
tara:strand:+ start:523 stop:1185 length:663 start_codon:yes stop_codon:yes gene_type:complete